MVATQKQQDNEQEMVPTGCPQCPEGGYDLVRGARRNFLLDRMNDSLELFQENGELDDMLKTLQDLVIKGLEISDLNRTVISNGSGSLFIGCREIIDAHKEPSLEIIVIDDDKRYSVEVKKSQISPVKAFEMAGCPLVGPEEQPGCDPTACPAVQQARAKTGA